MPIEKNTQVYDFAIQKKAISGKFDRELIFHFQWMPQYMEEFPVALEGICLDWQKCKFISKSKSQIPDRHGVYCFSARLGDPFDKTFHVPLYIGKAAPQYLSERFSDYLTERNSVKGRSKVVTILNKYKNELFFWWAELPRIHTDTVEEHLLICCHPPGNDVLPRKKRLWGKAFN